LGGGKGRGEPNSRAMKLQDTCDSKKSTRRKKKTAKGRGANEGRNFFIKRKTDCVSKVFTNKQR